MTSGRVEVSLHPAEISSDMHSGYYAMVSVGLRDERFRVMRRCTQFARAKCGG
jgi:hypothetical protein